MTDDMVRAVPDWINGFMEYTDKLRSPEHYRLWTAHSILGGLMERRIWSWQAGFQCYPNLFILLIAKPGIGKSVSINEAEKLWAECRKVNIGPSGMTKAALIDELNESGHDMIYNGYQYRYYPICLASDEFGILLPEHNLELLNLFNTLYDGKDGFSDRTRKDGKKVVEKPILNLIAGTQPDYLGIILPPTAFGMGFMSRVIMIYATKQKKKRKLFKKDFKPEELRGKLLHDMRIIQKIVGEMELSEEAEEFFEDWYADSDFDAPNHPMLENYNERRSPTLQKLSMIRSMSRDNELIIEVDDVKNALEMLRAAESQMEEVFKEMTSSGDKKYIIDIHRYCFRYCSDNPDGVISEEKLMGYINGKVDVHRSRYFIEALINGGRIKVKGANNVGYRNFIPVEVKD